MVVAIPKVLFPYEAHWMEGAMLSEISWILSCHPLYSAPNIHHVPSLYQPLYYYLTAAITSFTGLTFTTARITSVIATGATISMIYYVVHKETGKLFFAISAVGLYIAAFGKTEYGMLMARVDPLLTALLVGAFIMVYYSKSYSSLFIATLLFTLGFFTKQSALVFIPSVFIYFLFVQNWKKALFFLSTFLITIFLGIIVLNINSDGWYSLYTVSIPRAMSGFARWDYAIKGLIFYIVLRCWPVSVSLLFFPIRSLLSKYAVSKDTSSIYFGLFFASGIFAGFLGILNPGGGHNVLLPTAAGCALFLPLITAKLSAQTRYMKVAFALIPCQLILLISNPWGDSRNIVRSIDENNYKNFYQYVAALPGEVWIPYHSFTHCFTGKNEYAGFDFVAGAILPYDVRVQNFRYQLDTAFEKKHWSYILSDFKQGFAHYQLTKTIINLNKMHGSDDSLLYIYEPNEE
jgi:hypothetical protein